MNRRALRRLALQASRDASLRPVLHDALLETYPQYEEQIAWAYQLACEDRRPRIIVFNPRAMGRLDVPIEIGISRGRLGEFVTLFGVYELRGYFDARNLTIIARNPLRLTELPVFRTRWQDCPPVKR